MKTYKKPAASKILTRFDNELRNLLMEDLKVFKEKNQFKGNNQAAVQKAA